MPTIADLKQEIADATTLKFISSAFIEASAAKLRNIRRTVETNRQFYSEISLVYHLVKLHASRQKIKIGKTSESLGEKTFSVAVTSNQRFYGEINTAVMELFMRKTENSESDLLVIGSTGVTYLNAMKYSKKYQNIVFTKDFPNITEIKSFLDLSAPYDKVILYYPKFMSLLSQTVSVTDITQTTPIEKKYKEDEIGLIFEPELPKILDFFERQVRSLLFLQVMLEADLSRTVARLLSMTNAEDRADKLLTEKRIELRKNLSSLINAQLLETFAGIRSVRK